MNENIGIILLIIFLSIIIFALIFSLCKNCKMKQSKIPIAVMAGLIANNQKLVRRGGEFEDDIKKITRQIINNSIIENNIDEETFENNLVTDIREFAFNDYIINIEESQIKDILNSTSGLYDEVYNAVYNKATDMEKQKIFINKIIKLIKNSLKQVEEQEQQQLQQQQQQQPQLQQQRSNSQSQQQRSNPQLQQQRSNPQLQQQQQQRSSDPKLQNKFNKLKTNYDQLKTYYGQLETYYDQLEDELKIEKEEKEGLESKLKDCTSSSKTTSANESAKQSKIDVLTTSISEKEDELKKLRGQIVTLTKQLEDIQDNLSIEIIGDNPDKINKIKMETLKEMAELIYKQLKIQPENLEISVIYANTDDYAKSLIQPLYKKLDELKTELSDCRNDMGGRGKKKSQSNNQLQTIDETHRSLELDHKNPESYNPEFMKSKLNLKFDRTPNPNGIQLAKEIGTITSSHKSVGTSAQISEEIAKDTQQKLNEKIKKIEIKLGLFESYTNVLNNINTNNELDITNINDDLFLNNRNIHLDQKEFDNKKNFLNSISNKLKDTKKSNSITNDDIDNYNKDYYLYKYQTYFEYLVDFMKNKYFHNVLAILKEIKIDYDKKGAEIIRLEGELKTKNRDIAERESKLSENTTKLGEIGSLKETLTRAKGEIESLTSIKTKYDSDCDYIKKKLGISEEKIDIPKIIDDIKEKIEKVYINTQNMEFINSKIRSSNEKNINAFIERKQFLEGENKRLDDDNKRLDVEIKTIQQKLQTVEREHDELIRINTDLKSQFDVVNNKLRVNEGVLTTTRTQNEHLGMQLSENEEKLKANKLEIEKLTQELKKKESIRTEKLKKATESQVNIVELQKKIAELTSVKDECLATSQSLLSEKKINDAKILELTSEKETNDAKILELMEKIKTLEESSQSITQVQQETLEAKKTIQLLEDQKGALQAELDSINNSDLKKGDEYYNKSVLEDKISQLEAKITQLEAKITELEEKNELDKTQCNKQILELTPKLDEEFEKTQLEEQLKQLQDVNSQLLEQIQQADDSCSMEKSEMEGTINNLRQQISSKDQEIREITEKLDELEKDKGDFNSKNLDDNELDRRKPNNKNSDDDDDDGELNESGDSFDNDPGKIKQINGLKKNLKNCKRELTDLKKKLTDEFKKEITKNYKSIKEYEDLEKNLRAEFENDPRLKEFKEKEEQLLNVAKVENIQLNQIINILSNFPNIEQNSSELINIFKKYISNNEINNYEILYKDLNTLLKKPINKTNEKLSKNEDLEVESIKLEGKNNLQNQGILNILLNEGKEIFQLDDSDLKSSLETININKFVRINNFLKNLVNCLAIPENYNILNDFLAKIITESNFRKRFTKFVENDNEMMKEYERDDEKKEEYMYKLKEELAAKTKEYNLLLRTLKMPDNMADLVASYTARIHALEFSLTTDLKKFELCKKKQAIVQNDLEKIESERLSLELQNNTLNQQIGLLTEQLTKLENMTQLQTVEKETLQKKFDEINKKMEELNGKNNKLINLTNNFLHAIESKTRVSDITKNLDFVNINKYIQSFMENIVQLKDNIKKKTNKLATLTKVNRNTLNTLNNEEIGYKKIINDLSLLIQNLLGLGGKIDSENLKLKLKNKEQQSEIEKIYEELKIFKSADEKSDTAKLNKISELQSKLIAFDQKYNTALSYVMTIKHGYITNMIEMQNILKKYKNLYTFNKEEVKKLNEKIGIITDDYEKKIKELEIEIETLKSENSMIKKQKKLIESELDLCARTNKVDNSKFKDLLNENNQLKLKIESLTEEISTLTTSLTTCTDNNAKYFEFNTQLTESNKECKLNNQSYEKENKQLMKQLSELDIKLKKCNEQNIKLKKNNENKTKKPNNLQKSLSIPNLSASTTLTN